MLKRLLIACAGIALLAGAAYSGLPCAGTSTVTAYADGDCGPDAAVCPNGDYDTVTVYVTVRDCYGNPLDDRTVTVYPDSAAGEFCFCVGCQTKVGVTDPNGDMSVRFARFGGCGNLAWYAQSEGVILGPSASIYIASFDNNGDCQVNLSDFINFANIYFTADECNDYNCDGTVNLSDFISFANHYFHVCDECGCTATLSDGTTTPGGNTVVNATITNTSQVECTFNWTITKIAGSPTVNPDPANGSVTLGPGASKLIPVTMSVPVNTAARDEATMELNVAGGQCTDTGTICIEPTDETTILAGPDLPAVKFDADLVPATADFQGREVTEQDAAGSHDDCWFAGSAMTKFENLTGGTWAVGANNRWGSDYLSWSDADITYYRANPPADPRAPCSTFLSQDMKINGIGCGVYTHNTLRITIGETTVSAGRDGVDSPEYVYP
jgi:hypothetical protein